MESVENAISEIVTELQEGGPSYSRILVATDGSECALRAGRHAVYLAGLTGATLYVVNAVNAERAFHAGIHYGEAMRELERAGKEAMEAVSKLAKDEGIEVKEVMVQGRPHRAILEVADRVDADLVVVGSQGATGLERALIGSESEKVLRYARHPVLMVRAK